MSFKKIKFDNSPFVTFPTLKYPSSFLSKIKFFLSLSGIFESLIPIVFLFSI